MIVHRSFKHGWFYHYRLHETKIRDLCSEKNSSLGIYLNSMLDNCPHDYFHSGPRSSALRFKMDLDVQKIPGHEVCDLAIAGLALDQFNTAHTNVQMFMLQNDNSTLSIEVPIWLEQTELAEYNELFGREGRLTGHIDALRIENGKVWIWDYKPKAHLEKFATTQTNFYAIMLSRRTKIPLENFRCGYFDDKLAYVFKPTEEVLKNIIR